MSVPKRNTTWGTLVYQGKEYKVLNSPLSDELVVKLEEYSGDRIWGTSSAPWRTMQLSWIIEENKLFLKKLYVDDLLEELVGSSNLWASWVDELKLLVEDRKICKTYEKQNLYIREQKRVHLHFQDGLLLSEEEQEELYRSIEVKNYIDINPAFVMLSVDSSELISYLDNTISRPKEDELFTLIEHNISKMFQGNSNDISLCMEDLEKVLKHTDVCIYASAKGKSIEEMMGSLSDSVTQEKLISAKGVLLHLTAHEDYPIESIESIVNGIEHGLGIKDSAPFIIATKLSDEMDKDEVVIKLVIGI